MNILSAPSRKDIWHTGKQFTSREDHDAVSVC